MNQAISGIRNFLLPVPVSPRINAYVHHTLQAQSCRVTVWSPVNVDVFLNNKRRLVLKVDHYSGFDYSSNTITAAGEFTLIFSSKGFEKEILFDMPPNGKINYHLKNILTTDEIIASYDREDAIMHMKTNPTAYSFEQLGAVGNLEDIDLLEESLTTLSSGMTESDQHKNYLIAVCAFSLGKLCIKYSSFENVDTIAKIYDKYPAKMQYGYYFDNILKELTSSDEKYRKLYSAKGITGSRCKDKKSDIVSDPDLEHTGQSSELCDGQDVLRNAADLPPTPDEAFMFRYDEKNAGWSISLRYDKYTEIKIPDKYQGRLVTDIGSEAFKYCGSLTNVTIPSSVTSIGECAFYGCESLTNITIPSSVTIIGKKAFYGCKSLPSITIPSNVRIIEDYAFAGCCNLTRITIPSGIPVFGVCVFRRCGKLKKIIWLQNNDKEKQMRLEEFYQKLGRCRHCGGPFKKDLFSIKCKFCGDKKDY